MLEREECARSGIEALSLDSCRELLFFIAAPTTLTRSRILLASREAFWWRLTGRVKPSYAVCGVIEESEPAVTVLR